MQELTPSNFGKQISSDFPGLEVEKAEVLGIGWDHVAVEVNGSLIFRIPRGVYNLDKLSHTVAYETAILRHLQGKLPVAIPDPQYIAPNLVYFGYPKLQGEKLIDLWPNFSEPEKAIVWDDWVDIADAIHKSVPLDMARKLGVPDLNIHLDVAKEIFNLQNVDSQLLDFAKKTIQATEEIDMIKQPPLFIHNDLQFHNLLADPQTKRITAVIDWTDACIGTLEREFSMWEWSHDDQLRVVSEKYTAKTGSSIDTQQAKVFRHVEEVSDYVEQTKSGDKAGAEESLDHIRKWIIEAAQDAMAKSHK